MNKFYLIDNDIVSITSLQSQLIADNHHVFANHGDLGEIHTFREILREQPNLIIMNLTFPSMDGLSLLHRLQVDHYTNHVPVVIYASEINGHLESKIMNKGAQQFFLKELFTPRLLINRIYKIF